MKEQTQHFISPSLSTFQFPNRDAKRYFLKTVALSLPYHMHITAFIGDYFQLRINKHLLNLWELNVAGLVHNRTNIEYLQCFPYNNELPLTILVVVVVALQIVLLMSSTYIVVYLIVLLFWGDNQ